MALRSAEHQSKLAQVKETLRGRSDIVVVNELTETLNVNNIITHGGGWAENVKFSVAPAVTTYDPEALQRLMISLVPEHMQPTAQYDFQFYRTSHVLPKGSLHIGRLYFEEDIGKVKLTGIVVTEDPEFLQNVIRVQNKVSGPLAFEQGSGAIEQEITLRRRTWVSLFPDLASAGKDASSVVLEGRMLVEAAERNVRKTE